MARTAAQRVPVQRYARDSVCTWPRVATCRELCSIVRSAPEKHGMGALRRVVTSDFVMTADGEQALRPCASRTHSLQLDRRVAGEGCLNTRSTALQPSDPANAGAGCSSASAYPPGRSCPSFTPIFGPSCEYAMQVWGQCDLHCAAVRFMAPIDAVPAQAARRAVDMHDTWNLHGRGSVVSPLTSFD